MSRRAISPLIGVLALVAVLVAAITFATRLRDTGHDAQTAASTPTAQPSLADREPTSCADPLNGWPERTLIGAATAWRPGLDALEEQVGRMDVHRSFQGELPADFADTPMRVDAGVRISAYSFKPDIPALAAGRLDGRITEFLESIPRGHRVYLILWHEPENGVRLGRFTAEEFRAAFVRFAALVAEQHNPDLVPALVMQAATWDERAQLRPDDFWPGDRAVGVLGVTGYNIYGEGRTWRGLRSIMSAPLAWARDHEVPMGISGFGSYEDPADVTRKARWIRDGAAWAVRERLEFLLYWDGATADSSPQLRLWNSQQSLDAWRDVVAAYGPESDERCATPTIAPPPNPKPSRSPSPGPSSTAGPRPPSGGPMLVGAASAPRAGSTLTEQQEFERLEGIVGRMDLHRTYAAAIPSSFAASPARADPGNGHASALSFKTDIAALASGGLDGELRSFVRSIPAGHRVYLILYHEPEDNVMRGEFTHEQFRTAFRRFADVVHGVGNPDVRTTINLMTWTWNPLSQRDVDEFWPGDSYVDVLALDGYNDWRPGLPEQRWDACTEVYGRAMAWARARGLSTAIAEFGTQEYPDDPDRKAGWIRACGDYAAANRMEFISYWDGVANSAGAWRLQTSDQAIDAWRDVVSRYGR